MLMFRNTAEEIKDASRVLPLGMVWTLILNGTTGFVMLVTYAFCLGDIDKILETEAGFPFIQVFLNATNSIGAATGMTVVIMVLQFCAAISNVATTSRQLYAFARDDGLPFSSYLAHVRIEVVSRHSSVRYGHSDTFCFPVQVNPRFTVPLNALCTSLVIVCLLSLINIGSAVAFNAIMSLGVAALLSSYIISICCLRLKRWRGEPLPPARWSLGRWSSAVETFAILFLLVVYVFSFFPLTRQVTPETMNWSIVIFSGVVLFALSYYFLYARKVYSGPVTRVRQLT